MINLVEAVRHVVHVWPEVLGGGITYCLHVLLHGFYHRAYRAVLRLGPQILRGAAGMVTWWR